MGASRCGACNTVLADVGQWKEHAKTCPQVRAFKTIFRQKKENVLPSEGTKPSVTVTSSERSLSCPDS
jgi:phage FluMu protein Com